MEIHTKVQEAQFDISKKLLIRYKKGFGFWIHKEIENGNWYTCLRICRINPFGLGFKEQYGFGYKDMKPYFFNSFEEALKYVNKVDKLPYWEYNEDTHVKFFDTIMRAEKADGIMKTITVLENLRNEVH